MSELKPLVFSINDLAYIDEICVTKNFQNPHDHAVYKATEVDAYITNLEESHKKEVQVVKQCISVRRRSNHQEVD